MPSAQDWINNPLGVVEGIFEQNNSNPEWDKKVVDFFKEKLAEKEAQSWVPSLNDVQPHYLKPNSLVKFRCMVQDMFDPEFYMGVYEVVDQTTKSKNLKCGKYKDVTECVQVDFHSRNNLPSERQTFYCVPVPGESPWVKECYARSSQARVIPSTSYTPNRQKRSYDEDDDMDTQSQRPGDTNSGRKGSADSRSNGDCKRQETEAPSSSGSSSASTPSCASPLDLYYPLPGEQGPACLVKVYEEWESFKLNDTLEVYGILSVDPALSGVGEEKEVSSLLDPEESMETAEEQRAHSPPPSLVPRLHMLHAVPLKHNNPLLPPAASEEVAAGVLSELGATRSELLAFLTHVLLGDALAAEYLLLHLISNVYARRDILPLGKFALNLSGCPQTSPYTEHLHRIIQQLVPASYRLPMSLQNMNSMRMVPRKDHVANRLVSGALQLAGNTSLFLDETQLEQGQLDTAGVRNITALGNLISWQKVDYDFNYHQMEFPCNINVLVASEGRSLLPSDCQVQLQPQVSPPSVEEYLSGVQAALAPSQINKFRLYLTVARTLEYSITEEVTKAVEEDFVEMRKDDPQSMTAEDLHRMLVVSRLLSISLGQTTLPTDVWMKTKHMELLRMSRIQQQKSVNGHEP
ncbi:mini-chromosome maintenance complex-binding protein [Engraulis encrasicolus]|uniref:mini-chromosome maintenance complex-binding protein n=1 Tax=Engraulis encrasicolus TaxID=184585 RepID=UPI002FD5F334